MSNIVEDVVAINVFNPFKTLESSPATSGKRKRAPSEVWQHFTKIPNEHGIPEKCECHHCGSIFSCKPVNGTSHLQRHLQDRCPHFKKGLVQQSPTLIKVPEEDGNNFSRSKVWEHFTKLPTESGSPEKCECHHCGAKLSCKAANGTSHLQRHLHHSCPGFKKIMLAPLLLSSSGAKQESCRNNSARKFDQERSRRDLATLMILNELPFRILESQVFRSFINNLQPQFEIVSRSTIKAECMRIYESEKFKLKESIKSLAQRMCITIDLWTSTQKLKYMSITVHFIDNVWKLQRKLISFTGVESIDSADVLADVIINRLQEWDLQKLLTITMDNCLITDLSFRYLGDYFSTRGILLLNGELSHICCWARILSLVVQNGLNAIQDFVSQIRECVKYAKGSARQQADFLKCVRIEKISESRGICLDVLTRWDSTYEMLTSAVHYKEAFCRMNSYELVESVPSVDDWRSAELVCEFLEVFYTAAKVISGPTQLTSNCFFHEIFGIKVALREVSASSDPILCKMANKMCETFDDYWEDKERNLLLEVAVVLDPRYKLDFLRFCLQKVYSYTEVESYMYRVTSLLHMLYNEYVLTYRLSSDAVEGSSSNKIVDTKTIVASGVKKQAMFRKEFLKFKKEEVSTGDKLELDVYLQENVHNCDDNEDDDGVEQFDILAWWKANSNRFRILSRLARDVLAIPVSATSLESTFSSEERVLDPNLSSLNPSIVEALICSRDWLQTEGMLPDEDNEIDAIQGSQ